MLKAALTLLAVAGAGAAFSACGGVAGGSVATVDGEPIDQQEFDHWLTVAAKSAGSAVPLDPRDGFRLCIAAKHKLAPKLRENELARQCKQEYQQVHDQVLQLVISFRWIQGEAKAQNLTVTADEVTKAFDEQKKQSFPRDEDFQKFLKNSSQTLQDILRRVQLDLLSNKIRDRVVAGAAPVTDQAIADFYAEHKKRFAEPEKRDLRVVLTKRKADAARARAALEAGQTWKAVAKRYSIDDTSKASGGRLPGQYEGTLDNKLDKAVFSARKHKLAGPVKTQYGYYVFTVTRVTAARQQPFAEVKKTIKETLVAEAQQKALEAFVADFTVRWRAKTECAEGFKSTDCRNGPAPTPAAAGT